MRDKEKSNQPPIEENATGRAESLLPLIEKMTGNFTFRQVDKFARLMLDLWNELEAGRTDGVARITSQSQAKHFRAFMTEIKRLVDGDDLGAARLAASQAFSDLYHMSRRYFQGYEAYKRDLLENTEPDEEGGDK